MTESNTQSTWAHCSPWLLEVGVDCATTERDACFCPLDGSHDHLVSKDVADQAIANHEENWDGVLKKSWFSDDADTDSL